MMWKNWVNAVIGLWFIVAPWALGFSDKTAAVWTSVIFGLVQLIASAWAATEKNHTGWKSWQNWVSLIMGVWFVIQPFALSLNSGEKWSSVILGLITVLLNLWRCLTPLTTDGPASDPQRKSLRRNARVNSF